MPGSDSDASAAAAAIAGNVAAGLIQAVPISAVGRFESFNPSTLSWDAY